MNLLRLQNKIEALTLPAIICKIFIIGKCLILKIVDLLNNSFKFPAFTHTVSSEGLKEKYNLNKEKFEFSEVSGMFIPSGSKLHPDTGDMCIWNGAYSAYNSKFGDNSFFEKYYKFFLRKNICNKWHLLRGAEKDSIKTDISGDQLTGFVLACNEYKKKTGYLPREVDDFFSELAEDFILRDENNTPTTYGLFNPNALTINGSCSVILSALAVSRQWNKFDYLYSKCGYKYMLKYASIYLWSEEMGPVVLGRERHGMRAWFSCNVAIISLGVVFDELMIKGRLKQAKYIEKCIIKILKRNKYNTFFWAFAKDKGVSIEIPQEAINFYNTFANQVNDKHFIALCNQNSDWIWQRNPYKSQDGGNSRLDMVYVYDLLNKENICTN